MSVESRGIRMNREWVGWRVRIRKKRAKKEKKWEGEKRQAGLRAMECVSLLLSFKHHKTIL